MEKCYTVGKNKTGSCGSDHEFLIAKFRLTEESRENHFRSFRHDLNQIKSLMIIQCK